MESELLMILPRDSNGLAVGTQESKLRRVDIIDLSQATNILGQSFEGVIAPGGVVPGLDNLSEKWEGLALLSALDPSRPYDYFLFVANDNDFATTKGFQVGESYNDGKDIDTMFLVYRVTIAPVPEPETLVLALVGLAIVGVSARRRAA